MYTNFPFPAYLYLVCTLRQRTTGELVERAWQAITDHVTHRDFHGTLKFKESAMHYALGNLIVKAWEAHEAALPNPIPTPRFISKFRQNLLTRKAQNAKRNNDIPSMEKQVDMNAFPADQFGWFDPNAGMVNENYGGEPVFPSTDFSAPDWSIWNGVIQGIGSEMVNDTDEKMPYFFA